MADEENKNPDPTNTKAAASKGAAATTTKDSGDTSVTTEERAYVDGADLITPRALQMFTTFGSKGSITFMPGMKIVQSDVADYFPSQAAYAKRVKGKFIGLPE